MGVHVMVWDPRILSDGDPADWFRNGIPQGVNTLGSPRIDSFMEAVASAFPIPEFIENGVAPGDSVWCDIHNEKSLVIFEVVPEHAKEVLERIRILATFFDLKVHDPGSRPAPGSGPGSRGLWSGRLLWITALGVATLFIVLKMIR